jgi:phosphonopyruvate decarboxylase
MLDPVWMLELLRKEGVRFFTGVPDSLLKAFTACLADRVRPSEHVIAANEGAAVALAAGHHLASNRLPLVYLQNSGLGNLVNPLLSLADPEVYGLPMLLLIGWRGEPGTRDEPQHVKQGRVTLPLLDAMETPWRILPTGPESAAECVEWAARTAMESRRPVALAARNGIFAPYQATAPRRAERPMGREEAIQILVESLADDDLVVSTTGMISRELFEVRDARGEAKGRDFLCVGAMGHASSIAMGVALGQSARRVFCLDGDGAILMHMGSLAVQGQAAPANFKHIALNNGCHDSVGGQPTAALGASLTGVAQACGYRTLPPVKTSDALRKAAAQLRADQGPVFLEVLVARGARSDLGRPTSSPGENKQTFMRLIGSTDE